MVRSCSLSVKKFQDFCFNMMDSEQDQIVLEFIIETLNHSICNYTPYEEQKKVNQKLLDFIIDNYYTKFIQIKNTTVSVLCDLIEYNDISKLNEILSLLQIMKTNKLMKLQSEEISSSQKLIDLDLSGVNLINRKKLLLLIFENSHLDMNLKNDYLSKILRDDELDIDFKFVLESSIPLNKTEIWNKIVDPYTTERRSLYLKMKGFNRKSQYSILKNFLTNKFFDEFISVKENHSVDYTLRFLKVLSPKDIVDKDILTKFKNLRLKIRKTDHAIIYDLDKSKCIF